MNAVSSGAAASGRERGGFSLSPRCGSDAEPRLDFEIGLACDCDHRYGPADRPHAFWHATSTPKQVLPQVTLCRPIRSDRDRPSILPSMPPSRRLAGQAARVVALEQARVKKLAGHYLGISTPGLCVLGVPTRVELSKSLNLEYDKGLRTESRTFESHPDRLSYTSFRDYVKFSGGKRVIDFFKVLDADSSGELTRKEFAKGVKAMGFEVAAVSIDEVFNMLDKDGSGRIPFKELDKRLREKDVPAPPPAPAPPAPAPPAPAPPPSPTLKPRRRKPKLLVPKSDPPRRLPAFIFKDTGVYLHLNSHLRAGQPSGDVDQLAYIAHNLRVDNERLKGSGFVWDARGRLLREEEPPATQPQPLW